MNLRLLKAAIGFALSFAWSGLVFPVYASCMPLTAHITHAEKKYHIPSGLLQAIARVESKTRPFCVNGKGRSFCFASKAEATQFVRTLKQQGYRNISVGCMQLHVPAHSASFGSLELMMDPKQNIDYAARLLRRLKQRYGTWARAVERYNARFSPASRRYKAKVFKAWGAIQPASYKAHYQPPRPSKNKVIPSKKNTAFAAPAHKFTLHPQSLRAIYRAVNAPKRRHLETAVPYLMHVSKINCTPTELGARAKYHAAKQPLSGTSSPTSFTHLATHGVQKSWDRTYVPVQKAAFAQTTPFILVSWIQKLKNWMHL